MSANFRDRTLAQSDSQYRVPHPGYHPLERTAETTVARSWRDRGTAHQTIRGPGLAHEEPPKPPSRCHTSNFACGGNVWESNPPARGLAGRAGFEDQWGHQTPSAPSFSIAEDARSPASSSPAGEESVGIASPRLPIHVMRSSTLSPGKTNCRAVVKPRWPITRTLSGGRLNGATAP